MNTTTRFMVLTLMSALPTSIMADPPKNIPPRPPQERPYIPDTNKTTSGRNKLGSKEEFLKKLREELMSEFESGAKADKLKNIAKERLQSRLVHERMAIREKMNSGSNPKAMENRIKDKEEEFIDLREKLSQEIDERFRRLAARGEQDAAKSKEAETSDCKERIEAALNKTERLSELAESGDAEGHHKLRCEIEWGEDAIAADKTRNRKEKLGQARSRFEKWTEELRNRKERVLQEAASSKLDTPLSSRSAPTHDKLGEQRLLLTAEGYDEETIRLILNLPGTP